MLARPTLRRNSEQSETEKPKGQVRAAEELSVRVDRQEKRSFRSKEAAVIAGQVIKKALPFVRVTVVEAETGASEKV